MIDHLVDGRKSSCTPKLAERIAEALDVPLPVLFVASVPTVSRQNAVPRMADGAA
jgi:hypothetical protein